jgi:hypothetical protein
VQTPDTRAHQPTRPGNSANVEAGGIDWFLDGFIHLIPPSQRHKFYQRSKEWVEDAQYVLEQHRAQFPDQHPIGHYIDWPPDLEVVNRDAVDEILGLLPKDLQDMKPTADILVAEALRLNGYRSYIQGHLEDRPTPGELYGFTRAHDSTVRTDLGATYGTPMPMAGKPMTKAQREENRRLRRPLDEETERAIDAESPLAEMKRLDEYYIVSARTVKDCLTFATLAGLFNQALERTSPAKTEPFTATPGLARELGFGHPN